MRIRILNASLSGRDAVGRSIIDQARFFRGRGDTVQIQTTRPARDVPADIAALVCTANAGATSAGSAAAPDLSIYHYSIVYPFIESIGTSGSSLLYYHNVTPPALWQGNSYDREALYRSAHRVGQFAAAADLIVTPSAYNADQLVREYGVERARIRVVPFVIDSAVFHPGARDLALTARYGLLDRKVIMFAGRMAGNKRVDLLVDALALVKAKVPSAALLLVGDQSAPALKPTVEHVRARVHALGLQRDVVFAGMVEDLAIHYRLADVYASASIHEGFGVPLLEAMASSVPVVASLAAAHPEIVGDAGILCEPENAESLAAAILRVLESPELRADLVARGAARAATFTRARHDELWERIAGEVLIMNQPGTFRRNQLWALSGRSSGAPKEPDGLAEWQSAMESDLQRLDALADVMMRDYRVQSRAPLVGRLIAWLRQSSTSHLREPYLDPTLERQVIFNRQIMLTLVRMLRGIPLLLAPQRASAGPLPEAGDPSAALPEDIEARLSRIEAQLEWIARAMDAPPPAPGAKDADPAASVD